MAPRHKGWGFGSLTNQLTIETDVHLNTKESSNPIYVPRLDSRFVISSKAREFAFE